MGLIPVNRSSEPIALKSSSGVCDRSCPAALAVLAGCATEEASRALERTYPWQGADATIAALPNAATASKPRPKSPATTRSNLKPRIPGSRCDDRRRASPSPRRCSARADHDPSVKPAANREQLLVP